MRVLILLVRALLLGSSHLPKAPLPNTITLRIRRVSTYEFWEECKHTDHSNKLGNSANLTTVLLTLFGNVLTFKLEIIFRYFIYTDVLGTGKATIQRYQNTVAQIGETLNSVSPKGEKNEWGPR